jgi:hypothetical protein
VVTRDQANVDQMASAFNIFWLQLLERIIFLLKVGALW